MPTVRTAKLKGYVQYTRSIQDRVRACRMRAQNSRMSSVVFRIRLHSRIHNPVNGVLLSVECWVVRDGPIAGERATRRDIMAGIFPRHVACNIVVSTVRVFI